MFVNNQIWETYATTAWWHYLIGGILLAAAAVLFAVLLIRNHKKELATAQANSVSEKTAPSAGEAPNKE
jgi:hypothetical protein